MCHCHYKKFVDNNHADGDGFLFNSFTKPIACNGASAIAVVKPIRDDVSTAWTSVIDVFYDRLVIGVKTDSGRVVVKRNGSTRESETAIPDGQTTILSMIVQPGGAYKVYADGVEIISDDSASDMTSLKPNVPGPYADSINIGRNNPDPWTTYNGKIGDLFIYKKALSDSQRKGLEAYIAAKYSCPGPATRKRTTGK